MDTTVDLLEVAEPAIVETGYCRYSIWNGEGDFLRTDTGRRRTWTTRDGAETAKFFAFGDVPDSPWIRHKGRRRRFLRIIVDSRGVWWVQYQTRCATGWCSLAKWMEFCLAARGKTRA